jgi:pyruvate dehydrogenase E2 component (dihydrolipoamide acetyltransferase)
LTIVAEIKSPKSNADKIMMVRKMYFSNNDRVKEGDELIDLETSKTAIILDAPVSGFVEYRVQTGSSISVGEVVVCIHSEKFDENLYVDKSQININTDNKVISFVAMNYIKRNNIDISGINKHFINLSDVVEDEVGIVRGAPSREMENEEPAIETIRRPVGLAKQLEIDALSSVQLNGPVSTISVNVEAVKIAQKDSFFSNTSDSHLSIIIYEVSKLIKEYPVLNSYFQNGYIQEYVDINIGLALDIDDGLKVYNIRNCNNLTLDEIKDSISEGVYRYLRKDLTIEDITESTFTITDLSQYGVSHFIPLINNMQSAILGISAIDKVLNRFSLTLSFDHRVTEGKIVAKFLTELSERIENNSIN